MKNSSDIFGNRTRDLPACSAVSQPTACPILSGRTLLKTRRNFTYALLVTNNIRVISLLGSESTSKLKRPLEGSSISCNSTSFENGKLNLHIRPFSERAEEHPSNLLSSPMQPGFPLRLKPPHLPSECLFFLCNMYYNLTPRGSYSTPTSFSFRFTANIMHTWKGVNISATKFTTGWPMSGPFNTPPTEILNIWILYLKCITQIVYCSSVKIRVG